MTGTTRLALPYVASGQAQGEVPHNDALDRIDARFDRRVLIDVTSGNASLTLANLQAVADDLANELVASGASVARDITFAPFEGYRWLTNACTAAATFKVGSASIVIPAGATCYCRGDGTTNGLFQVTPIFKAIPADALDLPAFLPGLPGDGALVVAVAFARAALFAVNMAGSYLKAETAATADSTFTVKKNSTTIGTILVAASGTTGAFTFASAVSFAAGDRIKVIAPSPQDATLADISLTFSGVRT